MPGGGKGGGGSSSQINVHSDPITVDADSTVDIVGLDNVKVAARNEIVVPDPIKTEATVHADSTDHLSVDLKPVALDVCLNASIGKLPEGVIRQPYQQHLGFTWFGVELFGFNVSGETKIVMEDLPKRPLVEWPAQRNAHHHDDRGGSDASTHPTSSGSGLRIRVK